MRTLMTFTLTALTAVTAAAQAPTPNPAAQDAPHAGRHAGPGGMFGRLGADLNLTDAQKEQARSIFSAARQSGQRRWGLTLSPRNRRGSR